MSSLTNIISIESEQQSQSENVQQVLKNIKADITEDIGVIYNNILLLRELKDIATNGYADVIASIADAIENSINGIGGRL